MAVNPNPKLANNNTCFVSASGFGKSQALAQTLPASGQRVIIWDVDEDHKAHHYDTRAGFLSALIAGEKSGKPYRIAWCGDPSVDNFEWWSEKVWQILNGRKTTYVVIEELSDVSPTSHKALPNFGMLLRRGRKYGMRLFWAAQRTAEIPKTAFTQCPTKYIGYPDEGGDLDRMAGYAGVEKEQLTGLEPLNFYLKKPAQPAKKVTFQYKNIKK